MRIADFDYFLPEALIAKRPLKERSGSRLLVLHRDGSTEHTYFSSLPLFLNRGDMIIVNDTKVFPARLTGLRPDGKKMEILLVRKIDDNIWDVLTKGKYSGSLKVSDELHIELHNGRTAALRYPGNIMDILWKYGNMPIPPYIKRLPDESDKLTYQTVYAQAEGSIAAPTAGLHFTDSLLQDLASNGIVLRRITLHVGIGTFMPVRSENVHEHSMEPEYFQIEKQILSDIRQVKASGKRVIAVGTTTTRALEGFMSSSHSNGGKSPHAPFRDHPGGFAAPEKNEISSSGSHTVQGTTDIFIYPGYTFKAIDALITNFHLPRSTPLMLTAALSGWKNLILAYEEAISRRYRFLSYGDAMLIL